MRYENEEYVRKVLESSGRSSIESYEEMKESKTWTLCS